MKTLPTKAGLLTLLLAVAFLLAACGGAGGGQQGGEAAGGERGKTEETEGMMAGMDHGRMGHGSMGAGSKGMARQMVMENGKYSDERFIDAMVPHHQGAIAMAEVALKNTNNQSIRELAENIVSAQQREIEQMNQWRKEWYPQG